MKQHQCSHPSPNADMIFGHRIGKNKIAAQRQSRAVHQVRALNKRKEDNYYIECQQTNQVYDQFLEKMNTFKIQQALIRTQHRIQEDVKYDKFLDNVREEKPQIQQLKRELKTYIDRYAYQSKAPAPRHAEFYYFL